MNNSFDVEFLAENSSFQAEFSDVQVIGGETIIVDDKMSNTSTNPVQNKVAKAYVDQIVTKFEFWANSEHDKLVTEVSNEVNTSFTEYAKNLVHKDGEKVLSTNDFTNEYKAKLDESVSQKYVDTIVGDIEAVLDSIISAQENLIGGAE
jgi:hypothetical protein